MAVLEITNFTDPACPFAFSAEPHRLALRWLFGDQIAWRNRMVGLSERSEDYLEKGLTPEKLAAGLARLAREHGMPMDTRERPRMMATVIACRAVTATRLYCPGREDALLRRLRIVYFAGELIDERAVIARAAREVGVDPQALERWMHEPAVEAALREDMAAARSPTPAARALDHKLSGPEGERPYTCPSLRFVRPADEHTVDVPGFQPFAAYDVVIANLCPNLERRPAPSSAEEVLAWADEPLATAEVAAIMEVSRDDARNELARVAQLEPVGTDGWWTLPAVPARLAA